MHLQYVHMVPAGTTVLLLSIRVNPLRLMIEKPVMSIRVNPLRLMIEKPVMPLLPHVISWSNPF